MTGASFADDSLVIGMRHFNRILDFDKQAGLVHAEAGITLGKLYQFLGKRGFIISVQPGYPDISLGGCIAANVHGKNQLHEGTFADLVREIQLFHPAHGVLKLTRESNPEMLELTCGGFGLTGIILSATIDVQPLEMFSARTVNCPVENLTAAANWMAVNAADFDILYSWHDLARFDDRMGRGFIVSGNLTQDGTSYVPPPHYRPIVRGKIGYPFKIFGAATLPAINRYYYKTQCRLERTLPLFEVLFPFASRPEYFHAYGPKGFIEHQVLIPFENVEPYLSTFEALVRKHRQICGLATLKVFSGRRKLLRYNGEGISLALHVGASSAANDFIGALDVLNAKMNAITNLIKDSRIVAKTVMAQYPEYSVFRNRLHEFDPARLFVSSISQRLDL